MKAWRSVPLAAIAFVVLWAWPPALVADGPRDIGGIFELPEGCDPEDNLRCWPPDPTDPAPLDLSPLDSSSVSANPEPATFFQLIGLALIASLGYLLRRRRAR